jgi:hypothetical protein
MPPNVPPEKVTLEATDVWYFAPGDEDAFFGWLNKLAFVEKYEGSGRTLYITITCASVEEMALRELLALFKRYGIPMAQLAVFDREEFASWFRDPRAYWHREVFG